MPGNPISPGDREATRRALRPLARLLLALGEQLRRERAAAPAADQARPRGRRRKGS
jgi:hypothetical protein